MKMNDVVRAETFVQGGMGRIGNCDDMLHGLSWLGATEADVVTSLNGIGALAQTTSEPAVLDAIIANAYELQTKTKLVNEARAKLASKDPIFAVKLKTAMAKTGAPGTNEARAVSQEMNAAAKKAMVAKQAEGRARMALAQGDKRGAAADAVVAMTAARDALTMANRAEKTRLTRSLDTVAKTLDAQASYIEGVVRSESARGGRSARADALSAAAQQLRAQATQLRAQSAVVAIAPTVPSNAPTAKRIADVANRFNIRTNRHNVSRATMSVLSDIAEDPLAQVSDYEGARSYYGNDTVGRLMADIEFSNKQDAVNSLSQSVQGIGYVETTPAFARAAAALQRGIVIANEGYVGAVMPAFVGTERAKAAAPALRGLAGLGEHPRLFMESDAKWFGVMAPDKTRGEKWDRWCRENVSDAEQQKKCMNPGFACDALEPWSAAGKLCRGITDFGGAVAQVVQSAPAEIAKAQAAFNTVSATVSAATGQPPANTKPPMTLPNAGGLRIGTQSNTITTRSSGSAAYTPQFSMPSPTALLTPMNIALGALGLVGAGFAYTMWSRKSA